MASFDKFHPPLRYFAEVNVPGFDIARSIATAKKKKQKQRATKAQAPPQPPPVPTHKPNGTGKKLTKKVETCQQFQFEL